MEVLTFFLVSWSSNEMPAHSVRYVVHQDISHIKNNVLNHPILLLSFIYDGFAALQGEHFTIFKKPGTRPRVSRLLGFRFFNLDNGSLLHRNTAVFIATEFHNDCIICHVDDNAIESAAGENGITNCNAFQQFLLSLLLLLLRTDCQ